MKIIVFIVCCLWLSAYSRQESDYNCQGYIDGDVNMNSISYVENLIVAEPFEMLTVFFKESIPCHKHRSWYSGFQRIRPFAADPIAPMGSDNTTCINYLNLTWDFIMDKTLLSPNNDVIFTQIDSNYSSVRPICVQNKTAHYIKLQLDTMCISTQRTSSLTLSATLSTYTVPCSHAATTVIVTSTVTVNTKIGNSGMTDTCAYVIPSLSTSLGVLSAVLIFIIIAMFIYIRCTKNTRKTTDHVYARNPAFEAQENEQE